MNAPTPQKQKVIGSHANQPTEDWPELAPARPSVTPEQALAKELVRIQAENANKLLIVRSRALLAVVVLIVLSVTQSAFYVVPGFLHGQAGFVSLLFACSMVMHLSAVVYFLRAKDHLLAMQVLRLLLILNGIILFMGFALPGSLPLTLVLLVLIFVSYKRMEQMGYDN